MRPYRAHSLEQLIELIVSNADSEALCEFHDFRTIFTHLDAGEMLLADYLSRLRQGVASQSWGSHAHQAYDLTLDKFSRLSDGDGIDCRNYFRGALKALESAKVKGSLVRELALTQIMQRLARRHFELSLKECYRNDGWSRFEWNVAERPLTLMMPKILAGKERSRWLREHVPHVDPVNPRERDHVQAIIDQAFGAISPVSFDEQTMADSVQRFPGTMASSICCDGFARMIAQEKAENILEQRPAIQALGASRLKDMILAIFDALAEGCCRDNEIARAFGLTKATFSRFAGTQWSLEGSIPDLWRNTAQALAAHDDLIEAAREAGVWRRVAAVMERE